MAAAAANQLHPSAQRWNVPKRGETGRNSPFMEVVVQGRSELPSVSTYSVRGPSGVQRSLAGPLDDAYIVVNAAFEEIADETLEPTGDIAKPGARTVMDGAVEVLKQCYTKSPPALLFILVILGILGWAEIKSVDSRVDQFSTALQQTREEMIEGFGDLRTTIGNGDNTMAQSLNQLTNAIVLRVDRLEQRGQP